MNEVVIVVKAKNDTKGVFDLIRRDARNLGDDMAVDVTEKFTTRLKREAGNAGGDIGRAGDTVGDTIGARVAERIAEHVKVDVNERIKSGNTTNRDRTTINNGKGGDSDRDRVHVKVDVDVDKQSLLQRLSAFGKEAGERFSDSFGSVMSTFFSGDFITLIIKAVVAGGLAFGLAGVLGAAISSAILVALGGAAVGAGIASAIKSSPHIQKALGETKSHLMDMFSGFGNSFKGPLLDFLQQFNRLMDQLKPTIDEIGKSFGPVAGDLGHGIIGFLQNAMPGILRAMDAAKPLIETLAANMPAIGDAIGRFFDRIKNSAPNANEFFNDLLHVIPLIIRGVGFLIQVFSEMYHITRLIFLNLTVMAADWAEAIIGAARIALGWIPGWGAKFDRAGEAVARFKKKATDALNAVPNRKDIYIQVHVAGLGVMNAALDAISLLRSRGMKAAGGIVGAASGGIRSGLTWVGEHGPELAELPAGSRVWSNPDSMRMASGRSGGQPILVQLVLDGMVLAQQLLDPQREIVRRKYGGNVQTAMGS